MFFYTRRTQKKETILKPIFFNLIRTIHEPHQYILNLPFGHQSAQFIFLVDLIWTIHNLSSNILGICHLATENYRFSFWPARTYTHFDT